MFNKEEGTAPVAIIGFGTAGVNAAIALRNAGYKGIIKVFSNIGTLPYSPILTSYYAGGQKEYEECFPWSQEEIDELHLDIIQDGPVKNLSPTTHEITTENGVYQYSKCVVATGATPTCVGFPGVDNDDYQPLVLRTMEDAEQLRAALESPSCKRLLVSGASMVALKTLEAGLNNGVECTLVGMNPHVLDFNALPEAAMRFEDGLRSKGVTLKLGQTMQAITRTDDGLQVSFTSGDVAVFDEIAVAHGMRSNLEFIAPGTIQMDRALVVDDFMRTSDPDVYAAGDVAQGTELISGQKRIVGIWKNAALQGACAGKAIACELAGIVPPADIAIRGSISTNTIAVDGTLFLSAGTMDVTEGRTVEVREAEDMTVVYVFEETEQGERRLVGFNITCDNDDPGSRAYDTGAMLTLRIEAGCRDSR